MGDTISVKDKGTADAAIRDLGALQTTITTLGTDVAAEFDELEQLLNPTVDGETPGIEGVSSVGASLKAQADAVAASLGTLSGEWKGYVDTLEVLQEDAATTVTQQGGDKPTEPKQEAPKPAEPKPSPLTPDPSVPAAFSMK
ncbi:Uncharacterised protein [Mycobacteroides abscessus subsp. abscessus]|uniref:hypothetical protein n=1 Tax=Mycobacteroides abscessus TaxID=36809 RepID=UPI00092B60A6|nr:hypothetical protein [Mycobacteroides abscessus]MBE5513735.1 hypothetical protein [Mycobacteroides abscessus]MBN7327718.1 hypothetical protein [Mycobacteroides abscessus subsp. abscessus]SID62682.1 Uncharacterised protein [Mycobacteroides abscessus subsp. abscessus]SIE82856.1 Uncharacterised protein [Mycobacteroides abscessus subsp. abscessus]SIF72872.1 Uncharacterised protein [Mycobacteroides abscessus subsp. abscessus]